MATPFYAGGLDAPITRAVSARPTGFFDLYAPTLNTANGPTPTAPTPRTTPAPNPAAKTTPMTTANPTTEYKGPTYTQPGVAGKNNDVTPVVGQVADVTKAAAMAKGEYDFTDPDRPGATGVMPTDAKIAYVPGGGQPTGQGTTGKTDIYNTPISLSNFGAALLGGEKVPLSPSDK